MVTPVTTEVSQALKKGTVVMGGTFDPIHHGHLRSAVDILDCFQFETLRLIPCFQPVHKGEPTVSAEQRLKMVELGIAADSRLSVDAREILRAGPSYTFETLVELRAELGQEEPLIMVVGMDSFLSLPTWARWQDLLSVAHILVISRPGWEPDFISTLESFYEKHRAESATELQCAPAGKIWMQSFTPLAISSSQVRNLCREKASIAYLVPETIQRFIEAHSLYK
ncbi:MAG: nicotinate-nicotinamide nucleotide adenylyltransferase [Marinomonas sp.]|jgi:nicotinate-nucleotide adenylyltransferase|uniref:Probable nicotinate-nucleotide adenylyltransferase n=1 Tax=Marinomonas communis TaxID=28254 RepID=A0A4R6X9D8_9GAMM|nr:nicotinate-nicotinamide nucleotide adenylyltransferase [Marinomonas sp.]TDR06787.1 nicotinate-nucleotide adenylyltransferase [Marinomonas communis]